MQSAAGNITVVTFIGILAALAIGGWFFVGDDDTIPPLQAPPQVVSESSLSESAEKDAQSDIPNLVLQDFAGNEVRLQDLQGKPLVLNTWASWCSFCVHELPDFVNLQQELGDTVQIVAINRAESISTASDYIDDLGIGSDVLFLLDPSDSFYTSISGFAMPETLFIGVDGTLHFHKRGVMPIEEIRQRVSELK
jgi:thiol-disulfide isomerase/thioredoxin